MNIYQKKYACQVDGETLACLEVSTDQTFSQRPKALFVHGGWKAGKERVLYIMEFLVSLWYNSLSFDFSWHGESTGDLKESSLERRYKQATYMMSLCDPSSDLIVVWSSMWWEIAIRLLASGRVGSLLLFCPAVYSQDVYSLSFDQSFSDAIRVPGSWKNNITHVLPDYKGRLLVVIWDQDDVIPPEIIIQIDQQATNTKAKEILHIPGAPHAIHIWLGEHDDDREHVLNAIQKILS
jgi:pimeloyl-ACP methyl ester carboxylesterase